MRGLQNVAAGMDERLDDAALQIFPTSRPVMGRDAAGAARSSRPTSSSEEEEKEGEGGDDDDDDYFGGGGGGGEDESGDEQEDEPDDDDDDDVDEDDDDDDGDDGDGMGDSPPPRRSVLPRGMPGFVTEMDPATLSTRRRAVFSGDGRGCGRQALCPTSPRSTRSRNFPHCRRSDVGSTRSRPLV